MEDAAIVELYWQRAPEAIGHTQEKYGAYCLAIAGRLVDVYKRQGLGYAPDSFHAVRNHLRGLGYTQEELLASGLVKRSEKGSLYDVFRNRVMVPIFDLRGNVIAFGGRNIDVYKRQMLLRCFFWKRALRLRR